MATPSSTDRALNSWQPGIAEPGTPIVICYQIQCCTSLKSSCAACALQGRIAMMWDIEPGISMIQQQQDCLSVRSSSVLQVWRCARQSLLCRLPGSRLLASHGSACCAAGESLHEA